MQKCTSCKKEIEIEATKCPYCQGYQRWYKNPQYFSFLFILPFFFFVFCSSHLFDDTNFEKYEKDFSIKEQNVIVINKTKVRLITYRIKNDTKYKWRHVDYAVVSSNKEGVIAVDTGSDYSWVVQPNSDSLLTVAVKIIPGATSWSFKIKDLKSGDF